MKDKLADHKKENSMSRLAQNYRSVKDRVAKASAQSQRDGLITPKKEYSAENLPKIQLIAVSKRRSANDIRQIHQLGQEHFGENYLQEALEKIDALNDLPLQWHFIGPIQSNKTKSIAENFDWVHTLDRAKIAQRLSDQRPANLSSLKVCIQVNLDDESSKAGIAVDDIYGLASFISKLPQLQLKGLMFIPAPQSTYEQQLNTCQKAKRIFNGLQEQFPRLDTLSLGMSSDLEAAITAGSNMVRIGTDIFGARNYST